MKKILVPLCVMLYFISTSYIYSQSTVVSIISCADKVYSPLEEVNIICQKGETISVFDSKNRIYFNTPYKPQLSFVAGGATGIHTVRVFDKKNNIIGQTTFRLGANTTINDHGDYLELFNMLKNGMFWNGRKGYGEVTYKNKSYKYYVPWDLDNNNVLNGMQYFLPYGGENTDLLRQIQREDGMIWSFVRGGNDGYQYYESAYGYDYFGKDSGIWYVRQPVDNHSDYNYVNQFYKHWKATGNMEWMKQTIASAALALDYCYTDSIRWSKRFQLLKRPYCIDSWDFQVDDEYTPDAPISPTMVVIPDKTKFGIFFGDNTGYYEACNQVAEMYDVLGETEKANVYRTRGKAILDNLIKVSWNGEYFTHFIDEDPNVKRNLGVDESAQIAQGNMYSINRGLPYDINVAIIETYLKLKDRLPEGSPGEWYAIYPPFGNGFGPHNEQWQYMNGGIAGHAIGELAKGAYENGYENYASDIMSRLYDLGKKYHNKIYFSYTGSIPAPPPSPQFRTLNIQSKANMDLTDQGSDKALPWMNVESNSGNDMHNIPTGINEFKHIKFDLINPSLNNRKAVIAVSIDKGFPKTIEIPVNDTAASVYLLHTISGIGANKIAGAITLLYDDGTKFSKYMIGEKDVCGWWFPSLKTETSGVAWAGPNKKSTKVGVCWTVIDNPSPGKKIKALTIEPSLEGGIYAVLGISLSNQPHYIAPKGESYGGPDNWAAANGMSALIEGLAGVKNAGLAYDSVIVSPRWSSAGVDSVGVVACLEASGAYAAYNYKMDKKNNTIQLCFTSSGNASVIQMLIPGEYAGIAGVALNGKTIPYQLKTVGKSVYVTCKLLPYQVNFITFDLK